MNCSSSCQAARLCWFLVFQTRSGVNYVANLASRFHEFFVTGSGWCSGDSCLDEHLFKVGRLSICAESCAAEQVFGGRHGAVAFHSFITALLVGTMVGWYVCMRGRQFFDVCCFCLKSSVRGIFFTLFHCFAITLIG